MFLDENGESRIINRERLTDQVLETWKLTKREFIAFSPELIQEGLLIQT